MTELTHNQSSGTTQREQNRSAFLDAAISLFEESVYSGIRMDDIFQRANRDNATFYNFYASKPDWAIDVLDTELNKALAKQSAREMGVVYTPYARALGRLTLFEAVTNDLPGITQAPIEDRALTGASYSELLPNFHTKVNQAFRNGQERQLFRTDVDSSQLADFTIDSLALACLIRLNNAPKQTSLNVPLLLLNGAMVR